jgi:hypothetical protein
VIGTQMCVNPGEWNEFLGVWFLIEADPLAGPRHYAVTVHRSEDGALWFDVRRPNGGVRVQTTPPHTADRDGGQT